MPGRTLDPPPPPSPPPQPTHNGDQWGTTDLGASGAPNIFLASADQGTGSPPPPNFWSRQTRHGLAVCIWMHLVKGIGNSPSLGPPTPE